MYKQAQNSPAASTDTTDSDSKYTAAEILMSMTTREAPNSMPYTPVSSFAEVAGTPSFSGPNLLTPTTFASIEHSLGLGNNNRTTATTQESGFVPPVVPIVIDPMTSGSYAGGASNMGIKREHNMVAGVKRELDVWDDSLSSCSSTDPDYNPTYGAKREKTLVANIDPNTYLMPNSRRPTGPRRDRTNEPLPPVEKEKRDVRRERNKQAAAKCRQRRVDQTNVLIGETEQLEEEKSELENEISNLMKMKDDLSFMLDLHAPACKLDNHAHQHQQQQSQQSNTTPYTMAVTAASYVMTRPSTLPLRSTQPTTMSSAPVSITTPSNGVSFSHLGLDTLMEGHTGLTPLTSGPPPPSCSSQVQQHRNSSDGSGSSPNTSPNTSSAQLISL